MQGEASGKKKSPSKSVKKTRDVEHSIHACPKELETEGRPRPNGTFLRHTVARYRQVRVSRRGLIQVAGFPSKHATAAGICGFKVNSTMYHILSEILFLSACLRTSQSRPYKIRVELLKVCSHNGLTGFGGYCLGHVADIPNCCRLTTFRLSKMMSCMDRRNCALPSSTVSRVTREPQVTTV